MTKPYVCFSVSFGALLLAALSCVGSLNILGVRAAELCRPMVAHGCEQEETDGLLQIQRPKQIEVMKQVS